MKTKIISKLNKELLIIELPEQWEIIPHNNGIMVVNDSVLQWEIKGSYTLLGKPDGIKEEDARELVEILWNGFRNYSEDGSVGNYQRLVYKTAIESFNSALESDIYWENPLNNKLDKSKPLIIQTEHLNKWKEAQEKTFDKNRTLIFIKN